MLHPDRPLRSVRIQIGSAQLRRGADGTQPSTTGLAPDPRQAVGTRDVDGLVRSSGGEEMDVVVDEAGQDGTPSGIDDPGTGWGLQIGTDPEDLIAHDDHIDDSPADLATPDDQDPGGH
jgi:hypothetical protein